jgi:hypothetical protein
MAQNHLTDTKLHVWPMSVRCHGSKGLWSRKAQVGVEFCVQEKLSADKGRFLIKKMKQ